MTAPAYMAKVLNVCISVVAPEKSIVPWACATLERPANASATNVGPRVRAALKSFLLKFVFRKLEGDIGILLWGIFATAMSRKLGQVFSYVQVVISIATQIRFIGFALAYKLQLFGPNLCGLRSFPVDNEPVFS
jgi:hypothetical protein